MHPVIAAWIRLRARLVLMPKWTEQPAYSAWLADSEELSDWFNTLRRLQY